MQIKSARFTEEHYYRLPSTVNIPLPVATHPCIPSGILLPATPASFGVLLPRHKAACSCCGEEAAAHRFGILEHPFDITS
jgi:hypothetical protein